MADKTGSKVLVRKRDGRMLAGVCAGLADYLGFDATVIRLILAVVSLVTGGTGVLAYLVAWLIIPDEGQQKSIAEDVVSKKHDAWSG
jgi:phage shock protein PspC (stress-responsive transcriptional regulator)